MSNQENNSVNPNEVKENSLDKQRELVFGNPLRNILTLAFQDKKDVKFEQINETIQNTWSEHYPNRPFPESLENEMKHHYGVEIDQDYEMGDDWKEINKEQIDSVTFDDDGYVTVTHSGNKPVFGKARKRDLENKEEAVSTQTASPEPSVSLQETPVVNGPVDAFGRAFEIAMRAMLNLVINVVNLVPGVQISTVTMRASTSGVLPVQNPAVDIPEDADPNPDNTQDHPDDLSMVPTSKITNENKKEATPVQASETTQSNSPIPVVSSEREIKKAVKGISQGAFNKDDYSSKIEPEHLKFIAEMTPEFAKDLLLNDQFKFSPISEIDDLMSQSHSLSVDVGESDNNPDATNDVEMELENSPAPKI